MSNSENRVLQSYLDHVQVYLHTAQYTKVPATWRETWSSPEVCRLYFFREGSGWITIGGHTYHPQRGQLFLLPAGQPVSFGTDSNDAFGKYWCHFSATVGDANLFTLLDVPYWIQVEDESALERRFQQLLSWYNGPMQTKSLYTSSWLLETLGFFIDAASQQTSGAVVKVGSERIHQMLLYIDEHLASPISVSDLAELAHLHPQYLILHFKTMLGISPIAYINRKRIEFVKRQLVETAQSIGEIAQLVGWEAFYLSRMFKKQTGLSPSEYRRASRGAESINR